MQTWILDKTDGGEKALFWQVFVKGRKKVSDSKSRIEQVELVVARLQIKRMSRFLMLWSWPRHCTFIF